MNVVERADKVGVMRATVFYLLSAVLLLQTITIPARQAMDGFRLCTWIFTVLIAALLLTSFGGWLRPSQVNALLNDETTRDHRRTSMAAAFWATILSACATTIAMQFHPVEGIAAVRIVVIATLVTALCCFATLELRAAR